MAAAKFNGTIVWKHKLCANGVIKKEKLFIPVYDNSGNLMAQGSGEGITILFYYR